MNEDRKVMRSARMLFEYCNSRTCDSCAFCNKVSKVCLVHEIVGTPCDVDFNHNPAVITIKKGLRKKRIKIIAENGEPTMVDKIRNLLIDKPNAGFDDLESVFKDVTRSVVVTFYDESKLMYGKANSLSHIREIKKNEKWERISRYFELNPDATLKSASLDLGLSYDSLGSYLTSKRKEGKSVTYRKVNGMKGKVFGKTKIIAEYFKKNPTATPKQCAKETGIDVKYVTYRRSALKKKGYFDN